MGYLKKQNIALSVFAIVFLLTGYSISIAKTEDEKNNISIYNQSGMGVVNIASIVIDRDFFFNPVPREGVGSGSIIDKDGHILTNHHVIQDSEKIEVTLGDGSKWPAKLIGADPDNDLAVIKINAPKEKLTLLPMGDSSNLEVGQKVLAIGNPFGLMQTLTTGIISSLGRSIKAQSGTLIEDVIQTDAAINPGNSGGPLLDSDGKIIGINSAIISPTGASVGIGFAIPINTAKRILPELISIGHVAHPWIGATVYPLIPEFASFLGLEVKRGAIISDVVRGGPADRAGLKGGDRQVQAGNLLIVVGGDIIVEMDEKAVTSSDILVRQIRDHRPGDRIALKILRAGQFMKVTIVIGARPVQR